MRPDNPTFYNQAGDLLGDKGWDACWSEITKAIECIDHGKMRSYRVAKHDKQFIKSKHSGKGRPRFN